MTFSDTDITAMLAALGNSAIINGATCPAIFESPGVVVDQYTGQIESTAPAILMAWRDLEPLGIDHGSIIHITDPGLGWEDASWWTGSHCVTSIVRNGDGFARIALTRDF